MSEKQAHILEVKAYTRWSPYLEQCCLLVSANESYERAAEDIEVLTGVKVTHSTQQRLVHRQTFELPPLEGTVEEMSVDGGKVRLRTPQGQPSEWRDYKGVNLHECCVAAFFQDNEQLVNWVNTQRLSDPLTCLGDGHDGIWNIYAQIGSSTQSAHSHKIGTRFSPKSAPPLTALRQGSDPLADSTLTSRSPY